MYDVKITGEDRLAVFVSIDGITVRLSKKGNPKAVRSAELIASDLNFLLRAVAERKPLSDVPFSLTTSNVVRMIDALYLTETLAAWRDYFQANYSSDAQIREALFDYFGVHVSTRLRKSPFVMKAQQIGVACKAEQKLKDCMRSIYRDPSNATVFNSHRARSARRMQRSGCFEGNGVSVEFKAQDNLMSCYIINGKEVAICLSGNVEHVTIEKIHSAVLAIHKALNDQDASQIEPVVSEIGGKAAFNIMSTFFAAQTKEFLLAEMQRVYIQKRDLPCPHKIFKSLFHTAPASIANALPFLDVMEEKISIAAKYLIESSANELCSDKPLWVLYEKNGAHVRRYSLSFDFGTVLDQEIRDYLRAESKTRVACQVEFARFVHSKWCYIKNALDALASMNITLSSVLDLSPTDCMGLQSYFAQKSSLAVKTQRTALGELKLLYEYAARKSGANEKSPFAVVYIPKGLESKHNSPVTKEALAEVKNRFSELPRHIQMAFLVSYVTGARGGSLCSITTDALLEKDGTCIIKVLHKKRAKERTAKNQPTTTLHTIPPTYFKLIMEYVEDTQDLREQLDEPYLFVYKSPYKRQNSKRKPMVLSTEDFSFRMQELLKDFPLFHPDGTPVKVSFSSIRAEVGRAMFANGASADDVARMLGNTPQVAATHYNTMGAKEEAELYNQHYNTAFTGARDRMEKRHNETPVLIRFHTGKASMPVMYGTCENSDTEHCNKNDCNTCHQRIVCRKTIMKVD